MNYRNKNILKKRQFTSVDTKSLINYLSYDKSDNNWFGVSFQIREPFPLTKMYEMYINSFNNLINKFGEVNEWYIQPLHIYKLFPWFSKDDNFELIENLKNMISDPYNFKGFISLNSSQIKSFFKDLFYFSYVTHSQDLFVFNKSKPFVIQFNQHLSIDIISMNIDIIEEIIPLFRNCDLKIKRYS